ncbi:MAG: FAD-linked oxidase C-terminal domain-containing protein [Actinomycetota bacterium]
MTDRRLRVALLGILGPGGVFDHPAERRTYECDGLTAHRVTPGLVVLPRTTDEVVEVVQACAAADVPIVPRGAGSGLSAGALPHAEGVLIGLARMRDIRGVDSANRQVTVQAGVTTAEVNRAAAPYGLYFAPDPSSAVVCTLGGNVAENSGGAHCLKYGFTSNHVLALEVVLADGGVVRLGGAAPDPPGYDLRGAFVGSEGTMGIVTEVTVRLLRKPELVRTLVADFVSASAAGAAVGGLVAAGIVPAAVELIDNLAIQACEDAVGAGFSRAAGAVLIVELDGVPGDVDAEFATARRICSEAGSTHIRVAADADERALIWAGRKAAFAAVGRLSPDYVVQDGVIPRGSLPEVLERIGRKSRDAGMRVANVFHAGDGNLHPLVLYDGAREGEAARAMRLSIEIVELCVEYGGSISGEHGIGLEKACSMPRMFSRDDLEVMQRVRAAFDPAGRCNPGKIFPSPGLCGERSYRAGPLEDAASAERP